MNAKPYPALLTPSEAAEYLRTAEQTLAHWRVRGGGPKFAKYGHRSVVYRLSDLEAWVASRVVSSTTEADNLTK